MADRLAISDRTTPDTSYSQTGAFRCAYFFTGAFFECAERSGAVEAEINRMAQEWWGMLRNAVQKAQDRKEINSNVDARQISFDLNGTLIAGYWTYLAEKNEIYPQPAASEVQHLQRTGRTGNRKDRRRWESRPRRLLHP